ncbi:class I SAM-dependent methyltransferase [Selenomonas sp.]|uniref:class I SAM-dependent methyltransferase n=1 Tax=Selenomonas sp. TaxID=2053611 RepID=UPI0025E1B4B6|nr:class I SAM-dependent methyltransferase [Selenomonas sp.]MCI6285121.1 methyltransferase domain-containing protein [Selenomonas sp.]
MENRWQEIWNKRKLNENNIKIGGGGTQETFLELKRCDGFDVTGEGIPYESFLANHRLLCQKLGLQKGDSVFEVGCGSGANLFLLLQDGCNIGGMDYSAALIDIMKDVFPAEALCECYVAEASQLRTDIRYDAVFSDGAFHYFPSLAYAENVMEKMLEKATGDIAVIDVPDAEQESAYLAQRRAQIPDYDERYEGLSRLFYPHSFFKAFAEKHGLIAEFLPYQLKNYWNNGYVYSCFLHRKTE